MIPDCDNCEYQGEDGECLAFVENTFFDPLPCEENEQEENNDITYFRN